LNQKNLLLACLAVLLVGIIAPVGWLAERSQSTGRVFNWVFRAEWVHIISHSLLYLLLALVICLLLYRLARVSMHLAWLGGLVCAVGLLQEGMQLLTRGRAFGGPELFDLMVDLSGGFLGWLIFRWLSRRPQKLV
jgi:glycopeptide antibiotics resistance protein